MRSFNIVDHSDWAAHIEFNQDGSAVLVTSSGCYGINLTVEEAEECTNLEEIFYAD